MENVDFIAKHQWEEVFGAIYFTLPNIELTGKEWIARLLSKNMRISDVAHDSLRDENFIITLDSSNNIVLVSKEQLLGDVEDFGLRDVLLAANRRGFVKPPLEIGCIMFDIFSIEEIKNMVFSYKNGKSNDEFHFSIVVMNSFIDVEKDQMIFFISCKGEKIVLKAMTERNFSYLKKTGGEIFFAFKIEN